MHRPFGLGAQSSDSRGQTSLGHAWKIMDLKFHGFQASVYSE
jgi:hypothetical protein